MPIRNYVFNERFTPTNFNTYSLNNGMKWIASFTANSSANGIELYNCFTSEFDAYKIVINEMYTYTPSVTVNIGMQMATGGTTPYTNADYYSAKYATFYSSNTASSTGDSGATQWGLTSIRTSPFYTSAGTIDITGFASPRRPTMTAMFSDVGSSLGNGRTWLQSGLLYNQATYTGFKIFPIGGSSTLSAICNVYGYRKV